VKGVKGTNIYAEVQKVYGFSQRNLMNSERITKSRRISVFCFFFSKK